MTTVFDKFKYISFSVPLVLFPFALQNTSSRVVIFLSIALGLTLLVHFKFMVKMNKLPVLYYGLFLAIFMISENFIFKFGFSPNQQWQASLSTVLISLTGLGLIFQTTTINRDIFRIPSSIKFFLVCCLLGIAFATIMFITLWQHYMIDPASILGLLNKFLKFLIIAIIFFSQQSEMKALFS